MPTQSRKTILLAIDQQSSVLNALAANRRHPISYTPYGYRPLENGLLSLVGFNGELCDPLTGHYHLGQGYRQFNPVLMRFNSPDSWSPFGEGGFNAYAYSGGSPVNTVDRTGHAWEFLKPALRRLGVMDPASVKQTQHQLTIAHQHTLKNINTIYETGETPQKIYLAQFASDSYRRTHSAALLNNPEFAKNPSMTLSTSELKKAFKARDHYSLEVMDHVTKKAVSPLLERSQKITLSDNPVIHEIERLVPIPDGGLKKVADIKLPKRSTEWSRRIRQEN